MGMYDELRCLFPLPVHGANQLEYQTKDTPTQCLDLYEIREDGSLWMEDYDVEDHSDPDATGFLRMCGCMTRVNKRWVAVERFTGEIVFYSFLNDGAQKGWLEWSAYFENSNLIRINLLEKRSEFEK